MGGPLASLAVGATDSTTFTAQHTITQADIDASGFSCQVTVSGTSPAGTDVTDLSDDPTDATSTDDPTVVDLSSPSVQLVKALDDPSATFTQAGDVITGTFDILNDGNVPLTNMDVTSGAGGLQVTGSPVAGPLAPGATDSSVTWAYTVSPADVVAGQLSCDALVNADSPNGTNVNDASSTEANPTGNDPVIVPIDPCNCADPANAGCTGLDGNINFQHWALPELGSGNGWYNDDSVHRPEVTVPLYGDVSTVSGAPTNSGTVPVVYDNALPFDDDTPNNANNGNYSLAEGYMGIPCASSVELRAEVIGDPASQGTTRETYATLYLPLDGSGLVTNNNADMQLVSHDKFNFQGNFISDSSHVLNPQNVGKCVKFAIAGSDGADRMGFVPQWNIDGAGWVNIPAGSLGSTMAGVCECPCPIFANDVSAPQLGSGTTQSVSVSSNGCQDGEATTYVASSLVGATLASSVSTDGTFDVTQSGAGGWSFSYEVFCDGVGTGVTGVVSSASPIPATDFNSNTALKSTILISSDPTLGTGNNPQELVDGDTSGNNFFMNDNVDIAGKSVIQFDFPQFTTISGLDVISSNGSSFLQAGAVAQPQCSVDGGATWVDLGGPITWDASVIDQDPGPISGLNNSTAISFPAGVCNSFRLLGVSGLSENNPWLREAYFG